MDYTQQIQDKLKYDSTENIPIYYIKLILSRIL
jgi:hypothetical protein